MRMDPCLKTEGPASFKTVFLKNWNWNGNCEFEEGTVASRRFSSYVPDREKRQASQTQGDGMVV